MNVEARKEKKKRKEEEEEEEKRSNESLWQLQTTVNWRSVETYSAMNSGSGGRDNVNAQGAWRSRLPCQSTSDCYSHFSESVAIAV